jgi:glycosyltransferase involved in cell wall biosynthesis
MFRPDIIHAHYSYSGFLAYLAGARPLIVSLMGSDMNQNFIITIVTKVFTRWLWDTAIVKSDRMKQKLNPGKAEILPNGVDTDLFKYTEISPGHFPKGLDRDKKNILFVADPARPEKNWDLALRGAGMLNRDDVKLVPVYGIPHSKLPDYYNFADILLLTSIWEGSPNVVKEAMACGLPVVATGVGDVKELLEGVEGCYICSFDPADVAEKLKKALEFRGRTKGREKIFSKGLDSRSIAKQIIEVYENVIGNRWKAGDR